MGWTSRPSSSGHFPRSPAEPAQRWPVAGIGTTSAANFSRTLKNALSSAAVSRRIEYQTRPCLIVDASCGHMFKRALKKPRPKRTRSRLCVVFGECKRSNSMI